MESLTEKKHTEAKIEVTDPASAPAQPSIENEDKVFLIYNEEHTFVHSRKKLSKISLFFRKLFEGTYSDSSKTEINVIHSEDVNTFQEFLNCAMSEEPFDIVEFSVNDTLKKYEGNNFEELLKLLNLASYFAADNLMDSLLYILVSHWFDPIHLIRIWLISKQIGYYDMQNAAFAMILDKFELIPIQLLLTISVSCIEQIITNGNIRCSETYFESFINQWVQKNDIPKLVQQNIISEFKNNKSHKKDRYLQCITGFAPIPESGNKTIVFAWDGIRLANLLSISEAVTPFSLVGSRILGRGFSVYVIGGERSIGRNNFNKDIVRYCLITRKMYRVARLSIPRRHMAAAFVGNKLVLAGGVGMYRIKLRSVHVLDIHKGTWGHADYPDIPEDFTENPPACVFEDLMLFAMSNIYSYNIESNEWDIFWHTDSMIVNNIICCNKEVYVSVKKPVEGAVVQVYILRKDNTGVRSPIYVTSVIVGMTYNFLSIDNRIIWFFMISPGELIVEVGELQSTFLTYKKLSENPFEINNMRLMPHIGCFNIMSLHTLHPEVKNTILIYM